ncbi:MAG: hypothetical protein WD844_10705 [Thermoleophilaceae bacterium]
MHRRALALAVGLLLAGAAALFVPYLTEDRDAVVSTPATEPLFTTPALIELEGGERACARQVLLDPEAGAARIRVGTFGAQGQPLELLLVGPGYRESVPVPGGYSDNAALSVPVEGPAEELIGRACVENDGRRAVALYATSEPRTVTRMDVTVEGEPVKADLALTFTEGERQSILERTPEILDHATAFGPAGPWLAWALAFLVLLGVPALSLWALRRAFAQPKAATSRSASEITRE